MGYKSKNDIKNEKYNNLFVYSIRGCELPTEVLIPDILSSSYYKEIN
jgi:hypothetical protein